MTDDQRRRLNTLTDELSKLDGFVHMGDWMAHPSADVFFSGLAARANPCGTAACIAGKAGLMDVFKEEHFRWDFDTNEFTIKPLVFFGVEAYVAVFCGLWALQHIHTPQHAALVLRDFLTQEAEGKLHALSKIRTPCAGDYTLWVPCESVRLEVEASVPNRKTFPVSGWVYEPEPKFTEQTRVMWERRALSRDDRPGV